MAKTKEKHPSISAYFEKVYTENPDWLKTSSNDEVIRRWQEDNGGQEMPKNVRSSMANKKSQMRKKLGMVKRRRRKDSASGDAPRVGRPVGRPRSLPTALEDLEGQIDECLLLARRQNRAGLENVIKHLRLARRGVAWEMGQPGAVKD